MRHIRDREKEPGCGDQVRVKGKNGKYTFSIILTQGHEQTDPQDVRSLGYKVTKLVRIRIMNVELGNNLKPGEVSRIKRTGVKRIIWDSQRTEQENE